MSDAGCRMEMMRNTGCRMEKKKGDGRPNSGKPMTDDGCRMEIKTKNGSNKQVNEDLSIVFRTSYLFSLFTSITFYRT